jgi:hypothetical protein
VGRCAASWTLWFVAALGEGTAHARGTAPEVDVEWTAPEGCPRERFVDALHRHLVDSDATGVRVAARVWTTEGAWAVETTLTFDGGARTPRRFAGKSCEAVVDAVALATAIAIDPVRVVEAMPELRGPAPEPEPGIRTDAPDQVPAPPPEPDAVRIPPTTAARRPITDADARARPRTPPQPRSRRTRAALGAAAAFDGGALPGFGLGVTGGAALLRPRLRAELLAGWRAPVRVRAASPNSAGASIDLLHLGARLCGVVPATRRIELPFCAGLDVGRVRGRGFGVVDARTAALWWTSVVAAAGLHWVATARFALVTRAELGVPLRHHTFVIAGLGTLDRISPVYGRALVGFEVRLP